VPNLAAFLGTGKMPVPKKFNFLVGWLLAHPKNKI
jgi:hypothetical protein